LLKNQSKRLKDIKLIKEDKWFKDIDFDQISKGILKNNLYVGI